MKFTTLPELAISATLLAGCAGAPPVQPRVETPVFTPCVKTLPQPPEYEFDQLPASATDGDIILALARDWTRGRKYEEQLAAVVVGCLATSLK